MRVLLITVGTRGDIAPFAALAQRLVTEGHTAVLAAPEPYRSDTPPGVEFAPMGTDADRIMRAAMTRLRSPAQALTLAGEMNRALRAALQEQWRIAEDSSPTHVVAHPKALGGPHIAERLSVPFSASVPAPLLTPTAAFPAPVLARRLPGALNRLTYQLNRSAGIAYGGMVNSFRTETLGLPRMSRFSDYLTDRAGRRLPVLYPFSPAVVPRPADFPPSAHITGFWFRADAPAWEPPAEMTAFLDQGGPIVYVGFGSMGFGGSAEERGRLLVDALQEAGVRAVVSTGWGGVRPEASDGIHLVGDVPHEQLFPLVDAVVHHGGAGTTAACLRAGRPTLICPMLGDQPFWGRRVHDVGAGPEPLPLRRARTRDLAERIRRLVGEVGFAQRAGELAARITQEDGTGEAVRILESGARTGE